MLVFLLRTERSEGRAVKESKEKEKKRGRRRRRRRANTERGVERERKKKRSRRRRGEFGQRRAAGTNARSVWRKR